MPSIGLLGLDLPVTLRPDSLTNPELFRMREPYRIISFLERLL